MGKIAKSKGDWHHGDLKQVLLTEGVRVIEEQGVEALVLRKLARRAGVSSGAPYHHFPDRESLLAAIAEQGFALLHDAMLQQQAKSGGDPTARLEALGRGYVQFAVAHPGHFRVMFRPELKRLYRDSLEEAGTRAFQLLEQGIDECQRAGVAPKGDPAPLVLTAWAAVHGIASLWIDGPLQSDPHLAGAADLAEMVASTVAQLFAAGARLKLKRSAEKTRR